MLALRLTRGSHPVVLARRLLVALAAAVTGFLLLCALAYALVRPGGGAAPPARLAWCLLPVAATVHLALAVARTDPGTRPRPGLSAIGLGPARLAMIAAAATALACVTGSLIALAVFLHLRGDLTGSPFDGAAADLTAAGRPLPLPAALTLLSVVPLAASATVALALRPRKEPPAAERDPDGARPALEAPPGGLPWGVAVVALGLAAETYAAGGAALPGGLGSGRGAVLAGWVVASVGLAVAGPGLTHLCGRLLQVGRPGAARLLAGRALMTQARRIGRPLGLAAAVACVTLGGTVLYAQDAFRPYGDLTALGAALVVLCAVATLLTAAVESRQERAATTETLADLGAPAALLRTTAALRAGVLLAVFLPLTWLVARLAALPLGK
ncbi:hypothetical protein C6N75_02645 [Streptomyces solincola]|uniref:Uncharacterized protein n=1 Tax=Streptomyces solincola TaxID=2100817 RepID=A0A2S9Q292_9ACTN|nr:hypothetical protein [Streptomyces solincola]PRH80737.1 hypothetical protein C6N75_02645 [Streptomyces solincola]